MPPAVLKNLGELWARPHSVCDPRTPGLSPSSVFGRVAPKIALKRPQSRGATTLALYQSTRASKYPG